MKVLVSGGAGFIGSNIVEELLRRDYHVRVIDNFSTGKRENLRQFENDVELFEGDVRSYHLVSQAVKGVDLIFHQAALPSVPRSINDPITTNEVNVVGTLNVLDAARDHDVEGLVYASSSSIYGDNPELPKHEGMPANPLSPYAVSKLAGEKYCSVYAQLYGIRTTALRYFNVFGPRQDPASQYSAVIPKFIQSMLRGSSPIIFGDGTQSRDFTFVSNIVQANILAATEVHEKGLVFNCATHGRVTLNEMVASLNGILGTDIKPEYHDQRSGDIKHSYADISSFSQVAGYRPDVSFEAGLKLTVDWNKTYGESL